MKKIIGLVILSALFLTGCSKRNTPTKNSSSQNTVEEKSSSSLKEDSETKESSTEKTMETTFSSSEEITEESTKESINEMMMSPLYPEVSHYSTGFIDFSLDVKNESGDSVQRLTLGENEKTIPLNYEMIMKQPVYGEGHQKIEVEVVFLDENKNPLEETTKKIESAVPDEQRNSYELTVQDSITTDNLPSGLFITVNLQTESMKDGKYYPTKLLEQLVPLDLKK